MKRFLLSLVVTLSFVVPLTNQLAAAASASMSLSVGSSNASQGSYVTVYVRENSGAEPVNAVQANFSYPSNQLQYLSIGSSSAFSIVAQNNGGSGSVSIGRGALPAASGNQLIASVTFKVLASSGTASFNFTGGSSVVSANSNTDIASSKTGASVSLVAPAPVAPKDTTPPTISNISVQSITTNAATITWATSEPATSEVDYGFTNTYGLSNSNGSLVTSHSVTLNSAFMVPLTQYHFAIKSTDQAGNLASSNDQTLTTVGLDVTFLVTDKQTHKPLAGARVSWNTNTAATDTQGKATLKNLPAGLTTIVVRVNGSTDAQIVEISSDASKPQLIALKVIADESSWLMLLVAASVAMCVLISAGVAFAMRTKSIVLHLPKLPVTNRGVAIPHTPLANTVVVSPVTAPPKPPLNSEELRSRLRQG